MNFPGLLISTISRNLVEKQNNDDDNNNMMMMMIAIIKIKN